MWTRVQGGIIRSLQAITLAELVEFSQRSERALGAVEPRRKALATGLTPTALGEVAPTNVA
jgi:hypothetical protein